MVYVTSHRRYGWFGRLILAAVLGGLCLTQAAGAFATRHQRPKRVARNTVENMEEQWRVATLKGDADAMDGLLSDDYVGISAAGQVSTKTQQLTRMREHKTMLNQLDLSDIKVKQIGPIVAVVTSRAQLKGTNEGGPFDGEFRYTRVYQRLPNGEWKITSFEATRSRIDVSARPEADASQPPSDPEAPGKKPGSQKSARR